MAADPEWTTRLSATLLRWLLVSWGATWRWDESADASAAAVARRVEAHGPVIFAVWHEHILPYALWTRKFVVKRTPVTALASASRDGDLGALAAVAWGAGVVRGSSTRGGSAGVRGLMRAMRDHGSSPIFFADGPKGPARVVKPGAPVLARMAGAPVVPVSLVCPGARRLGTWDRMLVPSPGSRIGVRLGEPIRVDRSEEPETARNRVEDALLRLLESPRLR